MRFSQSKFIFLFSLMMAVASVAVYAQRNERQVRRASRGLNGAVAGGSEYATNAAMQIYDRGGNAVDAGVTAMFSAAVTEFSHFGFGGEAPILVRTADG